MTSMIITNTTDGHFIGFEFEGGSPVILLPNGAQVFIEKIIPLDNSYRFYSTNYTIEAVHTHG